MPSVSVSEIQNVAFSGINLSFADFNEGAKEGETIAAGDLAEVATAEVGESGQLTSYSYLRLGGMLDNGNQDSAKGKLFVDLRNSADEQIDPRTQFRFISRPKNGNEREPLTNFFTLRNANITDPSKRLPFLPVSVGGNPAVQREGRILGLEVRNPSTDVEVTLQNSDLDAPARGGY